jgi:hypothetical protein
VSARRLWTSSARSDRQRRSSRPQQRIALASAEHEKQRNCRNEQCWMASLIRTPKALAVAEEA